MFWIETWPSGLYECVLLAAGFLVATMFWVSVICWDELRAQRLERKWQMEREETDAHIRELYAQCDRMARLALEMANAVTDPHDVGYAQKVHEEVVERLRARELNAVSSIRRRQNPLAPK